LFLERGWTLLRIGMIGTGNMGTILIEAMLESYAVPPSNLSITNRTIEKAYKIKDKYDGVQVELSAKDVIKNSDLIFICVKPLDIYPLLHSLKSWIKKDQCIVSITSPFSVDQLEKLVDCSCARVIPSITNRAKAGVCLVTFGDSCSHEWRLKITELCLKIGQPVEIDEKITRVASDIVSCGPAFFSYLTRRFIDAAVEKTKIDEQAATILAQQMLIGLGSLLQKGFYSLPTLQEKVCVKGGVTGEGIKVMEEELGDVFEHLFEATHAKFKEDKEKIDIQLQYNHSS